MFSTDLQHTVASIQEKALIGVIKEWLGPISPPCPHGIGDDCAVIEPQLKRQIITVDALTYGSHFDHSVSAQQAGAKLIKRNLSDIAAMGGNPEHAVLALLCGSDLKTEWLKSFFTGIRSSCEAHTLQIVGGDISSLPKGQFSAVLTVVGTIESTKLRNGAGLGDQIYVTGDLGGSILQKHYTFTPRLAEGKWLAQHESCTALMDITDGLAKDLQSILPKHSNASIKVHSIPLANDAHTIAQGSGQSPLKHAFCDGEDYELLFTIRHDTHSSDFEAAWASAFPKLKLSHIGQITPSDNSSSIYIDSTTNEALPWTDGFEHLRA